MPDSHAAAAKIRRVCDVVGAQMAAARALAHTGLHSRPQPGRGPPQQTLAQAPPTEVRGPPQQVPTQQSESGGHPGGGLHSRPSPKHLQRRCGDLHSRPPRSRASLVEQGHSPGRRHGASHAADQQHRLELAARPARYAAAAKVRRVCDRRGAQRAAARALAHTGQMPPLEGGTPWPGCRAPPQAAPHTTRHLPPEQPRGLH
jgi:hypothetical protein